MPRYLDTFDDDAFAPFAAALSAVAAQCARRAGDPSCEISAAIEEAPEPLRARIAAAIDRALPLCESPIEKMILPRLVAQPYSLFAHAPAVLFPGERDALAPFTVAVVPQLGIGRRRVDFALAASRGGPVRFVVVECDGAQFHDRPHQVVADVHRDVGILGNPRVLGLVRLSGAEILRDPKRAAAKAEREFVHAWAVTNRENDAKFGRGRD